MFKYFWVDLLASNLRDEVNQRIDEGEKGGWCIEASVKRKNFIHKKQKGNCIRL